MTIVSAQAPAFEVATVKPNTSATPPSSTFFQRGSQVAISNHPLRLLMAIAFNLDVNKAAALITSLPGWADTNGFDIQAAVPPDSSLQQKRLMLQSLLAERFALRFHRETRQMPVFALTTSNPARLGPQLRRHSDDRSCEPAPAGALQATPRAAGPSEQAWLLVLTTPCGRVTGGILQDDRSQAWAGARRVTLERVAASLGELTPLDLPAVLNRTSLDGDFDFTIVWNPQVQDLASNAAAPAGLTFPQALREQLGLRLQRETGPVEIIVVDRVERPTSD